MRWVTAGSNLCETAALVTYIVLFCCEMQISQAPMLAACNTLANKKPRQTPPTRAHSKKVVYYHISLAHKPVERRLEPVEDALRRRRGHASLDSDRNVVSRSRSVGDAFDEPRRRRLLPRPAAEEGGRRRLRGVAGAPEARPTAPAVNSGGQQRSAPRARGCAAAASGSGARPSSCASDSPNSSSNSTSVAHSATSTSLKAARTASTATVSGSSTSRAGLDGDAGVLDDDDASRSLLQSLLQPLELHQSFGFVLAELRRLPS